jgi:hypothetical protein
MNNSGGWMGGGMGDWMGGGAWFWPLTCLLLLVMIVTIVIRRTKK